MLQEQVIWFLVSVLLLSCQSDFVFADAPDSLFCLIMRLYHVDFKWLIDAVNMVWC